MPVKYFKFVEGKYPGEFLVSEASGNRSREEVTISGPVKFEPGTFLAYGAIAGANPVPFDPASFSGTPQNVLGIAWEGVDLAAGESVKIGVIARDAEVNKTLCDFADIDPVPGASAYAAIWSELKSDLGIIGR